MTKNNAVMDRLLNNNKKQNNKPQITESEQIINDESHVLITTHRVESVRYKIYSLILLFIWFFVVTSYVSPSFEQYKNTKTSLKDIETKTSIFEARQKKYSKDKLFILKIEDKESEIVDYLNDWKWFWSYWNIYSWKGCWVGLLD